MNRVSTGMIAAVAAAVMFGGCASAGFDHPLSSQDSSSYSAAPSTTPNPADVESNAVLPIGNY